MKSVFSLFCILPFCFSLQGQVIFEASTSGPVTNQAADSRSVNIVDVNNDGWEDLFISNGPSGGQDNMLFLNTGDGHFVVAPESDITQDQNPSDGASFSDIDNDGDLDCFVVSWYGAENLLYLNDGSGIFQLQPVSGITGVGTYSETASWGDFDNDGWVDLYITNSTDFNTNSPEIKRNLLFKNQGGGQLLPLTGNTVVQDADISRSVNWVDYDNDNDLDLFVSNEENQANTLYENTGNGNFEKVLDNPITLNNRSSTGSSWADIDNDKDLDLFVANYNQHNELYLNDGNGQFSVLQQSPITQDGGHSFGSTFGDIDNDGDLDLFVANGFGPLSGVENFLYLNQGDGTFVKDENSIPDLSTQCSFGAAFGDVNNDGFLDLVVANCKRSGQSQVGNSLFINQGNDNHWLKVKLVGTTSNRSGIGAKVYLKTNINGQTQWQMRQISAQDGYNCQNSLAAHFGLGTNNQIDSLIVEWPSGIINRISPEAVDTLLLIEEVAVSGVITPPAGSFIKVYPIPSSDTSVTITISPQRPIKSLTLRLYDAEGRTISQQILQNITSGTTTQASLAVLPAGYYILRAITDDGRTQSTRLIVQ